MARFARCSCHKRSTVAAWLRAAFYVIMFYGIVLFGATFLGAAILIVAGERITARVARHLRSVINRMGQ